MGYVPENDGRVLAYVNIVWGLEAQRKGVRIMKDSSIIYGVPQRTHSTVDSPLHIEDLPASWIDYTEGAVSCNGGTIKTNAFSLNSKSGFHLTKTVIGL